MLKALACNLIFAAGCAGLLLLFGQGLLRIWAGPATSASARPILASIVVGSALASLSVTGTYALQALRQFRTVALISLAGKAAMIPLMIELLRHHGVQGLALSRLFYGAAALLVYAPLIKQLNTGAREEASGPLSPFAMQTREEASRP